MMLVDGCPTERLSASNRGLAYGDGVFRTLECCYGQPVLWRWQWARLCHDAASLGLAMPDEPTLLAQMAQLTAGLARAVVKIILTRSQAARGYALAPDAQTHVIISAEPWAGYPADWSQHGIAVALCDLRLALQPRLAGIKHLNRLENVLARSALCTQVTPEGLMLDYQGWVIEGTMSNLFIQQGRHILTPLLDRCGVAGALRAWLMQQTAIAEQRISLDTLYQADAVYLGNSLAGLWPVARLGERVWSDFSWGRQWNHCLAGARQGAASDPE